MPNRRALWPSCAFPPNVKATAVISPNIRSNRRWQQRVAQRRWARGFGSRSLGSSAMTRRQRAPLYSGAHGEPPPVSEKLSPPPRSGVRASLRQGARSGTSCDLHGQLQSEDGSATLCAQRDQRDQALEGGRRLAVSALALAAPGSYGCSDDQGPSVGSRRAGFERRSLGVGEGSHRDGGGSARA